MVQRIDSSDPFHKGFISWVIPQKENGWGKTALKFAFLITVITPIALGILDLLNYGVGRGIEWLRGRVSHPPKEEAQAVAEKISGAASGSFPKSDEVIDPNLAEINSKLEELNHEVKLSGNFPEENLAKGFKKEETRPEDIKKQIERDTKPYRERPGSSSQKNIEIQESTSEKKSGMMFIRVGSHIAESYDDLLAHLLFSIAYSGFKERENQVSKEFFQKVLKEESQKELVEAMFQKELSFSKDAVLALFNQGALAELSNPLMEKFLGRSQMDQYKDVTIAFDPEKKSISYELFFRILDENDPEVVVANVRIEATYCFLKPEESFQKYTLVD